MNQAQVQQIYLGVIDATIEGVRAELAEKGASDAELESLSILKARWSTRYTHTHDFTDDPTVVDKPASSAKTAKKVTKTPAKLASKKSPTKSHNGVIPVAALTNGPEDYKDPGLPSVPRNPVAFGKQEPTPEVIEVKEDERPAKRPRVAVDDKDDNEINKKEDLDSSDSDDSSGDSDDEIAEHLVLAQHDRVKKGNPKWKVILREGIVSIRGREYLFNKATCDLDF